MAAYQSREDLLDYLASELGCQYLSDLRGSDLPQHRIAAALDMVAPSRFPLGSWQDAVRYFTDSTEMPKSEEEARILLRMTLHRE